MMDLHPVSEATEEDRLRFYRGHSMQGTFRPGDYLSIEPVPLAAIRSGDVVIYRGGDREGEPDEIVHRVVAVLPGGLVTRGDNNPCADDVPVTADNLLGRVTHRERDGRSRPVLGGRRGLLRAQALRVQRHAWKLGSWLIVAVGRWPYRWLRDSGWVARLWRPAITAISLTTEAGPLVKYVCGQRTVAYWWPETGRFLCRKPYDLIISRPMNVQPSTTARGEGYAAVERESESDAPSRR